MSKIIGIDLGTTNSAMAVMEAGSAKVLENKEGSRTTPSVVAISKKGERLVGVTAKRQAVTNPENTIFSAKRLIGRKFSDKEVQKDKKLFPFEIRRSAKGGVEVKMGDKWYRPAEISAMVLQKLKVDAEERLGEEVNEAVITVPAYFDDSQRKATKDAGKIAGFEVKRIINEPTAAALAYGFNKKANEQIVVYDFGGGTFDVSVLETSKDTIEVKATGGDTHLGGDDFDQEIIDWVVAEYKKDQGIDLSKDELALQRLKEAAEKAKHELSSTQETEINIPFVTQDDQGPKHLKLTLTRAQLEKLVESYIKKSIDTTKQVVEESGFSVEDIDEIILVGGQTRMPAIQEAVKDFFDKEPQKDINPDEVVAVGAATQAGIIQGDVKDVLLLDVTPLSLGIETLGGVFTKIIPKNTTVPTKKSQIFSTAADNQTSVEIKVYQGEREMAEGNKLLGRFILDGIPPAPRGVPQIEVTFDINAEGILNVSAKDKGTGKEQSIRIEETSELTEEEVEEMKKEAQKHMAEDKRKRKLAEVKNRAEMLAHTAEKTLKEAGDKVDEGTKKEIEEKIKKVREVKDSDNKDKIEKKTKELSESLQQVGAKIYQGQKGAPGAQAGSKSQADKEDDSDEDTVEGEVEED